MNILPPLSEENQKLVDKFNILYYNLWKWDSQDPTVNRKTKELYWRGHKTFKTPTDFWIYQEIISSNKPTVIIETGTFKGASALFFSDILKLVHGHDNYKVITVDVQDWGDRPLCDNITYLSGYSTSDEIISQIRNKISSDDKVMVILDSDHSYNNVINELYLYSSIVSAGQYLVVEDTNLNGHPVIPNHGPGPYEAVEEFVKNTSNFIINKDMERFLLTLNPNGFLFRAY